MSSVICFNLDLSKIFSSSGNGLNGEVSLLQDRKHCGERRKC